ncbi:hypothetical protein BZZ08_02516 [Streptomyces sp. MH60]|nr:hypothetical protein BZZ08_02516 [Streptomyces sp. MH60]
MGREPILCPPPPAVYVNHTLRPSGDTTAFGAAHGQTRSHNDPSGFLRHGVQATEPKTHFCWRSAGTDS